MMMMMIKRTQHVCL